MWVWVLIRCVACLRAPASYCIAGIIDKAKEVGIKDAFEDKDKARMANVSCAGPTVCAEHAELAVG